MVLKQFFIPNTIVISVDEEQLAWTGVLVWTNISIINFLIQVWLMGDGKGFSFTFSLIRILETI